MNVNADALLLVPCSAVVHYFKEEENYKHVLFPHDASDVFVSIYLQECWSTGSEKRAALPWSGG